MALPVYSGLRMPDGGIMQNGNRAQELENVLDNQDTYWMYLWRLLSIAMSVFEWKNLPDGVDPRMFEYWLLQNGFCVFFYDEDLLGSRNAPEGYAVLQCMINGKWDMYNYPIERRAYAVNGMNVELNDDNSVLVFDNYLRVPMFNTLELFARRLAEIDRTIDVNVRAQKTPKVVHCDEKQRLTFKNLAMQVDGNLYWLFLDKNVNMGNVEVLDLEAPYVSDKLNALKHQYWNEALTFLGVENVNTEKKERLITDEVMTNMGDVEAQRFVRLNARKWACTQINDLFGLDVDVDFRSGIYIKADGFGSRNIATTGMKDTNVLGEQETGYGDDAGNNGVVNALRKMLGV